LIEIGHRSRGSWAAARASDGLGGAGVFLGLIWLIRGFLGIGQYSTDLLLASFGLIFLGRLFSTKTSAGAARAVSSFLWEIASAAIIIIIAIWFLGWVASEQSDVFPAVISSRVPDLVIVAIAFGLGAYAVDQFAPSHRRARLVEPVFLVPEGKGPTMEGTRLAMKHDTIGMAINRNGKTIGCVLLGDVSASFETPMGMIGAPLTGPLTTIGIPFQGRKLTKGEVVKMTGKTPKQLVEESRADATVWDPKRSEGFDLPFIHMWSDEFETEAEIGPLKMRQGPGGGEVKIGPVTFDSGEKRSRKWLAKGVADSFVRTDGRHASAKWNGSSLSIGDSTMKLTVGSDSFSYSPTEVKTITPFHSLQVTQDKITLDTRKFTLKVTGDTVVLRTEEKTRSTESKALASDLRTLLTETAKRQVSDVMEGTPIDLSEMLTATEEVLAKHG
jgi:hypothetical protein